MTTLMQHTKKKSLDVVIYCDGFLTNKEHNIYKTGGCSVATIINGIKVFQLTIPFPNKRPFTKTKKITVPMMEYFAVYNAMVIAGSYNLVNKVVIYSDAETVVNQLNNIWQVNNKILKKWYDIIDPIFPDNVMLLWIKRGANVKVLGH